MAEKKKAKQTRSKTREGGFSAEERAAMRERARELKSQENGEADVLAKIAKMPPADRRMAERFHALVKATVPSLAARTWYGMPAYTQDGKVVCFFQSGQTFKARYATIGFSDKAHLDDGSMWPTSYALKALDAASEAALTALLRRAVG